MIKYFLDKGHQTPVRWSQTLLLRLQFNLRLKKVWIYDQHKYLTNKSNAVSKTKSSMMV